MSANKRLLDWSQNRKEVFHWDQHEGKMIIEAQEDCEPLIKVAKDMSELQPSKEWRHSAVIPQFVLDQSMREKWEPKDWKRWANDSHNKMFRTWPGRL